MSFQFKRAITGGNRAFPSPASEKKKTKKLQNFGIEVTWSDYAHWWLGEISLLNTFEKNLLKQEGKSGKWFTCVKNGYFYFLFQFYSLSFLLCILFSLTRFILPIFIYSLRTLFSPHSLLPLLYFLVIFFSPYFFSPFFSLPIVWSISPVPLRDHENEG